MTKLLTGFWGIVTMTNIKIRNNLILALLLIGTGLLSSLPILMAIGIIPLFRACYLDLLYNISIEEIAREIFGDDFL